MLEQLKAEGVHVIEVEDKSVWAEACKATIEANTCRLYTSFGRATREDFETLLAEVTGEDLAPMMRDYLDTYILN